MNRVSVGILVGFVALGVAVVAVPRGDYRLDETPSRPTAPPPTAAPSPEETPPVEPADAPPDDTAEPEEELAPAASTDEAMPDASAVPELQGAPKSVTFGVVLVVYEGAQAAPSGARSKSEAEKLAKRLAEVAQEDFSAAVKQGDPGSTANAGKMFRNVLEPQLDYALFSLEKGKVAGPIDTPRGYWIVRRID